MSGAVKTDPVHTCFFCKTALALEGRVMRTESCPHCRSDLHVCLNCRFYDEKAYNQCREPVTEPVRDKDRANFCTYFEFRDDRTEGGDDPFDAKKKLDSLFDL